MSYMCDNCGKRRKLTATKEGKYLCKVCKIVDEDLNFKRDLKRVE